MFLSSLSAQKVFIYIGITLFIVACSETKNTSTPLNKDVYLPTILQNIQLGMRQNEVLQLRKNAYIVNAIQETPREVYTEDIETDLYTSFYYLFSKTGAKELVEINILHKSPEAAQKTINTYFGQQKNEKQNEWHKTLKNGRVVHATWRKQKVFIYLDKKETNVENAPKE